MREKEIAAIIRQMIETRFTPWDMLTETMEQYWERRNKAMDELEAKLADLLSPPAKERGND